MKNIHRALTLTAWGLIASAASIIFLLPRDAAVPTALATAAPDAVTLYGVLHDFRASHPDMGVVPGGGAGHYAGNVQPQLVNGRPAFFGVGTAEIAETVADPGPPWSGNIGADTGFPTDYDGDDEGWGDLAIATKVTVPFDVVTESISAYIGDKDDSVRYAIYTDGGALPGTLVAQTGEVDSPAETELEWVTLALPEVTLTAGDYWLALSFKHQDQEIMCDMSTGTTIVRKEDFAGGSGFDSTWGTEGSVRTMLPSLYLTATQVESDVAQTGNETPLPMMTGGFGGTQLATRVAMPEDGTLLGVTAYVGGADADVAFAIYADDAGEPGMLLAETLSDVTDPSMGWMTLYVPDLPLTAGDYWLAVSLGSDLQKVATAPGAGLRQVAHDATAGGFRSTWGTSDASPPLRMSIYGSYRTGDGFSVARGYKVTDQFRDAQGRPIAPIMAGVGSDENIEFAIVNQSVIPGDAFAVEARVLGAAIQTGSAGYHVPVTMRLNMGGVPSEPFGPFQDPVLGNVNDDQDVTCDSNGTNPRCAVVGGPFSAGTFVQVEARSWKKDTASGPCTAAGWDENRNVLTGADSLQVAVLRNGDPIPEIEAMYEQVSAADYLGDYLDLDTDTMVLADNQVIYLFELGTTGSSSSADFQDLVVLLTLASDTSGFCGGAAVAATTTLCGAPFGDVEGTLLAAEDGDASAGVTSPETFSEWFRPVMGTNLAVPHPLALVDDGTGVYEHSTTAFHPADDRGYGNEGQSHNHYFTYSVQAVFDYDQCGDQFVWFDGDDDAYLFIDNRLVMDRGGVRPGFGQHVQLDRLGLVDGQRYEMRFFFAQRQTLSSDFHFRTNIRLRSNAPIIISDAFD